MSPLLCADSPFSMLVSDACIALTESVAVSYNAQLSCGSVHAAGPHPAEGRLSGSPHPRGPGCAAPGATAARPLPSLPLLHAIPHSPPRSMSPSQPPSLSLQVSSVWLFCVSMPRVFCKGIITMCSFAADHSLTVESLCQSDFGTRFTDYLHYLKPAVRLPELVL